MFRPVRKHSAIRIKREPTRTPVWSTEEFGRGQYPREYAHELLEIARERTQDALCVTGIDCYLFRKKKDGRRCSCTEAANFAEPNLECPVCFGTGLVGGWDKEGCVTEVFDVTYPQKTKEMVVVNPHAQPNHFEGSVTGPGQVTFTYRVPKPNLGLDALRVMGENVTVHVKDTTLDDSHYVELTEGNLNELLRSADSITLRINFTTPDSKLTGIYVRVKINEVTYKVEHSQLTKGLASGEFMLPDLFEATQAAFDVNLPSDLSIEDFFEVRGKRFRFKAVDLTPYESLGHGLGFEGAIRPITEFEVAFRVP